MLREGVKQKKNPPSHLVVRLPWHSAEKKGGNKKNKKVYRL
jgi:hypothetical protein